VPTKRQEILYNIENVFGYSAVMKDGWKLVNGTDSEEYSNWFGSSGENVSISFESYASKVLNSDAAKSLPELRIEMIRKLRDEATVKCEKNTKAVKCSPLIAPCLFNIIDDPCEQNNLADLHPAKTEFLITRLDKHYKEMLPSRRRFTDINCDPVNFNYTWSWWQKDESESKHDLEIYLVVAICILLAVAFTSFICAKFNKKTGSLKIMAKK
jgi:arylsulfatase B